MFRDRDDAGAWLAKALAERGVESAVVLALPRGGVPVGAHIAKALGAPLGIIAVRKVGHPGDPEYALCAVDEAGTLLCNESEARAVDRMWLAAEVEKERAEAARRMQAYRGARPSPELRSKTVIIVDDGAATGLTLRLALKRARSQEPVRLIAAVPVLPAALKRQIEDEGVEVVSLEAPEDFRGAVGAYYREFEQVSDAQVVELLK
ncbi:MAG: phosphoribosyl transferase [Patescibacteria group bacterium]|nr:phosphoribosyl transferase [Patescibacteria group bacterium]